MYLRKEAQTKSNGVRHAVSLGVLVLARRACPHLCRASLAYIPVGGFWPFCVLSRDLERRPPEKGSPRAQVKNWLSFLCVVYLC